MNHYSRQEALLIKLFSKIRRENIDTPSCHKQQLQAHYKQEGLMDKLSLPA